MTGAGTSKYCAAMLVLLLAMQPAHAADPVRKDCRSFVKSTSSLPFADDKHRLWYARYWTGKCASALGWFCFAGSPTWNDTVSNVLRQAPKSKRAQVLKKACRLGQLIGFEWAKENHIRCIHTSDLKPLSEYLTGNGNVIARLDLIERKARAKLGCR